VSDAVNDAVNDERHLEDLQCRLAAHLRDPEHVPAPAGIEERRLAVYRELLVNNVSGLLAGTFPVLQAILGPQAWLALARDFYRAHHCHTPLFLEIAREFLDYLAEERVPAGGDPPFLYELAHYEWVELALATDEQDLAKVPADRDGDLLRGVPVPSPLAWPLAYRYPVHRLSPAFRPTEPPAEPSFYVARRGRDDQVGFLHVNAVTLRLLERLQQEPELSGAAHLDALADEIPQLDRDAVLAGGAAALREFLEADVILGTRPG
jgi:hypothetical protein